VLRTTWIDTRPKAPVSSAAPPRRPAPTWTWPPATRRPAEHGSTLLVGGGIRWTSSRAGGALDYLSPARAGIRGVLERPTSSDRALGDVLRVALRRSPTTARLVNQSERAGMPLIVGNIVLEQLRGAFLRRDDVVLVDRDAVRSDVLASVATAAHEAMHALDECHRLGYRAAVALEDLGLDRRFAVLAVETAGFSAGVTAARELGIAYHGVIGRSTTLEQVLEHVVHHPTYQRRAGYTAGEVTAPIRRAVLGILGTFAREVGRGEGLLPFRTAPPAVRVPPASDARVQRIVRAVDARTTPFGPVQ